MIDARAEWTDRLQELAEGLDRETAREFVDGLYIAAQDDLAEVKEEADDEREE